MKRSTPFVLISLLLIAGIAPFTGSVGGEGGEIAYPVNQWDEVMSYTTTVLIGPGDQYNIRFDPSMPFDQMLHTAPGPPLHPDCTEALGMVPEWMRINLTHRFRTLSPDEQSTFARLIIDAENESYIDEIAFTISHLNVETLRNDYFFPQLISHNAEMIYQNARYLNYVRIKETKDYTTLLYQDRENITRELPADIYYWYVVIPDIGDEVPTYVDPEYNYAEDPPFDRDYGVSPPEGKFWRDWLFNHHRSEQPMLRENLMKAGTVWEAIDQINDWISGSMTFTSDNERPNQPVRIYWKGIGRCGEYQDMRSAAARAGLIPVLPTSNTAEDHVWNEFWDGRWVHWDGMVDNPLAYENGWGKTISSVWNIRGDGYTWSVTDRYSEGSCTFTATVLDSNNMPVDGARVDVQTENFYQPEVKTTTISGSTDLDGKVSFILGEGRNYWVRVDGGDLGSYPANPLTPNELLVMDAQDGAEYNATYDLPLSADELRFSEAPSSGELEPYMMKVDLDVENYITRGRGQFSGGRFDQYEEDGKVDFFIAEEQDFQAYQRGLPFSGHNWSSRVSEVSAMYNLHEQVPHFVVLSNGFSQWTSQAVNITLTIYGRIHVNIESPMSKETYNYGDEIEFTGSAESVWGLQDVHVEISRWSQDSGTYQEPDIHFVTDTSGKNEERWSSWSFVFDTEGVDLANYLFYVYAEDDMHTVFDLSLFTVWDLQPPDLTISSPTGTPKYRQGDPVLAEGTVGDNYALESLTYVLDEGDRVYDLSVDAQDGKWSISFDTGRLSPGQHTLTFMAEDHFENVASRIVTFEILETGEPYVSIDRELDDSVHMQGGKVDVSGYVEDESEIDSLMIWVDGRPDKDITGSIMENGDFTYAWSSTVYSEGVHLMTLVATDSVGNEGSDSFSFILDGTAPMITIEEYNEYYSGSDEVIVEGKTTDEYDVGMLEVSLDGGGMQDVSNLLDRSGSFDLILSELYVLDDGDHGVKIRSTDEVGNWREVDVDIVVDDTAPVLSLVDIPDIVLSGEVLQIVATIEELYPDMTVELSAQSFVYVSEVMSSDSLGYDLDTADLRVGTVDVVLRVTDHVGNMGEVSETFELVRESTDSDGDGVPDWWEYMYMVSDPYFEDSDQDPDGDGYTNLEEYLGDDKIAGNDDYSDPVNPASTPSYPSEDTSEALFSLILIAMVIGFFLVAGVAFLVIRARKSE